MEENASVPYVIGDDDDSDSDDLVDIDDDAFKDEDDELEKKQSDTSTKDNTASTTKDVSNAAVDNHTPSISTSPAIKKSSDEKPKA